MEKFFSLMMKNIFDRQISKPLSWPILEVTVEDCAEKGIEILSRDWPGIVVCDIRLPNMDGMQFLLEVQKIDLGFTRHSDNRSR